MKKAEAIIEPFTLAEVKRKVVVCPSEDAVRIRTEERGPQAA